MVKKIAAPRKAASKAPSGKKAPPKKVTAPKTHKPKGSAKEKLAYLNKGEMKALVKRKGTPARRGPKGIPSFADDSSSSKGVSRGDNSGTKGSGSTKTANGSVSNSSGGYNSGTSGSRGGGASTQAPGAGGNSGRVGGGGSGSGARSPMSGQGASFSSPQAASSYNRARTFGNANSAAPNGMIGTPRGYVNAADAARIDRAMAPAAAVGKELLISGVAGLAGGPLLGRVAAEVGPTIMKAASPYVSRAATTTAQALEKKVAELTAQRLAAGQRVGTPGEMAVSMRSLPVTMEQRIAQVRGPSTLEKMDNALQNGIDRVTNAMGYGTGPTARAKAVSAYHAGAGAGMGAIEAGRTIGGAIRDARLNGSNSSIKGDLESSASRTAGGKTNRGGYRAGGAVKPRKTFKNK